MLHVAFSPTDVAELDITTRGEHRIPRSKLVSKDENRSWARFRQHPGMEQNIRLLEEPQDDDFTVEEVSSFEAPSEAIHLHWK